jgi:hypothetical protein
LAAFNDDDFLVGAGQFAGKCAAVRQPDLGRGQAFRVAEEFTYRKTAYTLVPNNEGFGLQTQV